jgi:hypothetical protein
VFFGGERKTGTEQTKEDHDYCGWIDFVPFGSRSELWRQLKGKPFQLKTDPSQTYRLG